MTYKTNITLTEESNLEKTAQEIGERMWQLTGEGKKATALKLYREQPKEIQDKIREINHYAVRAAQFQF
jgi:hypothetical protein|tara:strand:- start:1745 stop:1951 length:207 start_codon:yes stop_codon:yes gene_type:complete